MSPVPRKSNAVKRPAVKPSMKRKLGGKCGKFVPNANLSFDHSSGREKHFLNLNRSSVVVNNEKPRVTGKVTKLTVGNETDIFETLPDGSLKWDVEFATHPGVYSWSWDIKHSPGLRFLHQPEILTPEEIAIGAIRPDDIKGSYAVYGAPNEVGSYRTRSGTVLADYGLGKLGHIKRPLFIDSAGNQAWGTLTITPVNQVRATLTVSIDPVWFDASIFPTKLDPTFGNTAIGASTAITSSSYHALHAVTGTDGGTLDSLSFYMKSTAATGSLYGAVYENNGSNVPGALVDHEAAAVAIVNTFAWYTLALNDVAITGSTEYWLLIDSSGDRWFAYDNPGGSTKNLWNISYTGAHAVPTWPNPMSSVSSWAPWIQSGYVNYTVSDSPVWLPNFSPSWKSPFRPGK